MYAIKQIINKNNNFYLKGFTEDEKSRPILTAHQENALVFKTIDEAEIVLNRVGNCIIVEI